MKQRGFLKATSVMSILFCMIVLYQLKQIYGNEVKIFAILYIYIYLKLIIIYINVFLYTIVIFLFIKL